MDLTETTFKHSITGFCPFDRTHPLKLFSMLKILEVKMSQKSFNLSMKFLFDNLFMKKVKAKQNLPNRCWPF